MITDQDFEEIKELFKAVRNIPAVMNDREKELDRKWSPINVAQILIESLTEAKAKLKILQTPLSTIALQVERLQSENEKLKERLKIVHPLAALPDCMMPDGADPCAGFQNMNLINDKYEKALWRISENDAAYGRPFDIAREALGLK